MSYRKEKKQKYQPKTGWRENLRKRWQSRYPVLLFVGIFAVLIGLYYVVLLSPLYNTNIHPHILAVYSAISVKILNFFGQHAQASGDLIFSSAFSISIARGCDAIEAIGLFSCALLAFPARWKSKIIGLVLGIIFLFILNVVRVVSLFLAGVYSPKIFDMLHVEVWQVIFIILAILLWILWLRYFALPKSSVTDAPVKTRS